jgi:Tfp pilus assembly protein PilF
MAIRDLSDLQAIWNYSNSRFIAYYTFAINYHFGELGVYGYHLFNLIVHLINAALVYFLTLLIFSTPAIKKYAITKDKNIIAFITALLFVSHPLATGSVTYIVQRMASLVTLFYLLSLAFYIKARLIPKFNLSKYGLLAVALISFVLAMYTKQNAFTLPFVIMLIEICFFSTKRVTINLKDYRVISVIAGFVIMTLVILSNYSLANVFKPIQPDVTNNFTLISPLNYLLTQFSVIVKYIQLLILPINQNLDYDYRLSSSLFELRTFVSFLFLLSLVVLAIFQYKKNRIITFGVFWFFITLSIESSFIPISDLIFEHRTYLPSFGFFIVLSSIIYALLWEKRKNYAIAIFAIIIISNSYLTYERNKVWKDELTLLEDVISKSPNEARNYNNRASIYMSQKRYNEAMDDLNIALELRPQYGDAYYNRGLIFSYDKKYDSALENYNKAVELIPDHFMAYNNRGLVHKTNNNLNKAFQDFNKAIELKPNYDMAYTNRGTIHMLKNKYLDGIQDFTKAIELNPNLAAAYVNRGVAESRLGNKEKSCQDYKRAIELGYTQVEQWYNQNCR